MSTAVQLSFVLLMSCMQVFKEDHSTLLSAKAIVGTIAGHRWIPRTKASDAEL